jgi:hypothetical protein
MGDDEQVREAPDSDGEGATDPENGPTADCVPDEEIDEEHLSELPDGSGCVEVWEHLADQRGDDG